MSEIWKPVPSMPGVLASNAGRIVLPPSHVPGPCGGFRLSAPEPTAGTLRSLGAGKRRMYLGTWSRALGNVKVHQLVCEAFHGPKPFPNACVLHLDENSLNNRPENLKWGTHKENMTAPGFREATRVRASKMPRAKGQRGFGKPETPIFHFARDDRGFPIDHQKESQS